MNGRALRNFTAWLIRVITGARAQWQASPSSATRQRIYFANHTSHFDAAVIWATLPAPLREVTRPVAAADYWSSGVRKFLAQRIFRAILIERNADLHEARHVIDRMVEAIGEDESVILFPEGTRGSGEQLGAFKSGLAHLSERKPDMELVPVYLDNLNRVLPKGERIPLPLPTRVIFGGPVARYPDENRKRFTERMRQSVIDLKQS